MHEDKALLHDTLATSRLPAIPLSSRSLTLWRESLRVADHENFVPREVLMLLPDTLPNTAGNLWSTEYRSYNPFSQRYVNDAYVWSQILTPLVPRDGIVVEVGPGRSQVIPMALCMIGFTGTYYSIDETNWIGAEKLAPSFTQLQVRAQVSDAIDLCADSDVLILNHLVDDLYMSEWEKETGQLYFSEAMHDPMRSHQAWIAAMSASSILIPRLEATAREIASALPERGSLVVRTYPSAYETTHRLYQRIQFTFDLHHRIMVQLSRLDLQASIPNVAALSGAPGSRYPTSYWVWKRRTTGV